MTRPTGGSRDPDTRWCDHGGEALPDTPQGRARLFINMFIAGLLLVQLAVPLSCYLMDRGSDERFCWRMFSSVHMRKCQVAVVEMNRQGGSIVPRSVPLRRELHTAWVKSLKRFRRIVVDKFLHWRCEQPHTAVVTLTRTCRATEGTRVRADTLHVNCATKHIKEMERVR